jgi:hypothetical protein
MWELDHIRSARNTISHSWDINSLGNFFQTGRIADMHRMEDLITGDENISAEFAQGFKPLAAFRVRLVWVFGRLVYEAAAYNRAKEVRVRPEQALYEKPRPKWLGEISKICFAATREISKQDK